METSRSLSLIIAAALAFADPPQAQCQTSPPPDILFRGNHVDDGFGASAALAGDVNGDGHLDVLVGAEAFDDTEIAQGRVFLFYGPIQQNRNLNQADATITGEAVVDGFGNSVAGVGDVNNDGFDDILVGARSNDTAGIQAGRAYLFYGPLAGDLDAVDADFILSGEPFYEVGWSLTGAGDPNADGFDDVLVGAWMAGLNGKAFLFYGPLAGEQDVADAGATITGDLSNELLGDAVGSADLNDDDIPDLIIGAPRPPLNGNDTGRTYVFFGPVLGDLFSSQADVILFGEELNDEFGTAVAGAGDLNGDGADDLLVGAHQLFRPGNGKAYVFHGPLPAGIIAASDADAILLGEAPVVEEEDLFGEVVASAGDANGDGFDDVLVAAPNNNVGGTRAGRAYLFLGPLAGTTSASTADRIFTGGAQDLLGTALAPLGDLSGDGADDFLIGGPGVFESSVLEYAAIFFGASPTGVQNEMHGSGFALFQNHPNPVDGSTRIVFDLPVSGEVRLRIFDLLGREIETLVNARLPAGRNEMVWRPDGHPDGVYFYQLDAGSFSDSKKLTLRSRSMSLK
jgi:hypothetical protein